MSREELAIRRRLHGGDDGGTASAMDHLAASLLRKGEFPEAEKLAAEALRIRRSVYGDKSEEVAASLLTDRDNRPRTKEDAKREEAVTRERLGILREKYGNDERRRSPTSLNDLAVARMQQGDMAGGREALTTRRSRSTARLFGEDHPEIASAMENLGNVMYQTDRPAETIKMLEQVLAIRKRAFGDESEPVSRTLANLATVNSISGNPAAAEPLYREAYAMMIRFLGPDNPDVSESAPGTGPQLPPPRQAPRGGALAAPLPHDPPRRLRPDVSPSRPHAHVARQASSPTQARSATPRPTSSSSSPTRASARTRASPTRNPGRDPGARRSVQGVGEAGEGEGAGGGVGGEEAVANIGVGRAFLFLLRLEQGSARIHALRQR